MSYSSRLAKTGFVTGLLLSTYAMYLFPFLVNWKANIQSFISLGKNLPLHSPNWKKMDVFNHLHCKTTIVFTELKKVKCFNPL